MSTGKILRDALIAQPPPSPSSNPPLQRQAKENSFRKRVYKCLNSPAYSLEPYHVHRDDFMTRCKAMKIGENAHSWDKKLMYMDSQKDL